MEMKNSTYSGSWPISIETEMQGCPNAPSAMQNASRKSSGGEGRQNKEVMVDKIYLFVWRENKHMKPIKQSNKCVDVYV